MENLGTTFSDEDEPLTAKERINAWARSIWDTEENGKLSGWERREEFKYYLLDLIAEDMREIFERTKCAVENAQEYIKSEKEQLETQETQPYDDVDIKDLKKMSTTSDAG